MIREWRLTVENSETKELDIQTLYCLLDHCRLGIIIADAKGMILWGNDYYSAMAGFNIKDFIGQDIRIISRRNLVTLSGPVMADQVLETGEELTDIVTYPNEDFIATTLTPVRDSRGEIRYLIYSVTNCSESIRMQSELNQLNARNLALESQLNELLTTSLLSKDIIISDNRMKQIYKIATRLASVTTSVMILGESGVGKDVYAKFIHSISNRKNRNFIHVNLGAIPKSLFESELFGYEAGAFTGASKTGKTGLIELADGGTLFLDEIGELDLDLQTKLLQVVQEHSMRSIGSTEYTSVNIRIIAATNRSLPGMIKAGQFRLDLYYRLNVVSFDIPPLSRRRQDIRALIEYLSLRFGQVYGCQKTFTPEAMGFLLDQEWLGNIREIQNFMEKLYVLEDASVITDTLLKENYRFSRSPAPQTSQAPEFKPLKQAVAEFQKTYITEVLRHTRDVDEAAQILGMDRAALNHRLKDI